MTAEPPDLLWYAAYGSNMHAARLDCYLAGGTPQGAARSNPGSRDPRRPERTVPLLIPGGVYFAQSSASWGGGVAFYDPALPGQAPARGYLLTVGQFSDLVAQEMDQPPGTDLDLAPVLHTGRQRLGPGRYETLVRVGSQAPEGYPILTFTAPWAADAVPFTAPSAAYLRMLGLGLREAHGWTAADAATYLCGLSGARGSWDVQAVTALLADAASATA